MTNYADQLDIDIFIQEVVESEIPADPIVEYFKKENDDLRAKLKISEDLRLQCLDEKMELGLKIADIDDAHELELADVIATYERKMVAMRVKLKKIRKYVISQEAWYHYAVGSIVTLVAILIVFVVGFKFFR